MSFERLFEAAEHKIDGVDANQWLWDYRSQIEKTHGQCFLYEHVIDKESWSNFITVGLRRLLLHLEAKKLNAPCGPYLLIIVWKGTAMHIFGASHYFDRLCTIEQKELASLLACAKQTTPVMALPPPKSNEPG
jgi:hypothetical protein